MAKNMKRFMVIMRSCFKGFSTLKNKNNLDEIQITALVNARHMMKKEDATLLLAPISEICYIEWKHYFIRFNDSAMTITNGKYSYYISFPSFALDRLRKSFYRNVEDRKKKMESDYDRKTLENLNNIGKELGYLPIDTLCEDSK